MADEMKVNPELEAGAAGEGSSTAATTDIEDKLRAASDNVSRANADARARRTEQERSQKRSESDAKARLAQTEKKHMEDERAAAIANEQRLAALEYAENYRQKLLKNQRKAVAAQLKKEREERAAAEARAREAKAQEIAAALERERAEAKARHERANELLAKVTAKVKKDRDPAPVASEAAEAPVAPAPVAEAVTPVAPAPAPEAPAAESSVVEIPGTADAPATEPAVSVEAADVNVVADTDAAEVDPSEADRQQAAADAVERFMVNEMLSDDGNVNIPVQDPAMQVVLTAMDDRNIAPPPMSANEFYARQIADANARHQYIVNSMMMSAATATPPASPAEEPKRDEELEALRERYRAMEESYNQQLSMMDNARQTAEAIVTAAAERAMAMERQTEIPESVEEPAEEIEEPVVLEEVAEEPEAPVEEPEKPVHAPIVMNDPEVLNLKATGATLVTKKQLEKYLARSKKAAKRLNTAIDSHLDAEGMPIKSKRMLEAKKGIKSSKGERKREMKKAYKQLKKTPASAFVECPGVNTSVAVIQICGCLLELRCDNLAQVARLSKPKKKSKKGDKLVNRYADLLFADLGRYNDYTDFFEEETGEFLYKMNLSLANVIAEKRGIAVVPAIGWDSRMVEIFNKACESKPESYTYVLPSMYQLRSGEEIAASTIIKRVEGTTDNVVSRKVPRKASLTAEMLLAGVGTVKDKTGFKIFKKRLKNANKQFKKMRKFLDKQDKKMAKLAKKALKKKRPFSLDAHNRSQAVSRYLLDREGLLLDYMKLVHAREYGKNEYISAYKRSLVTDICTYNKSLDYYSEIIGIPLTKIGTATVDEVLRHGTIPVIPTIADLYELFETVGDKTRIVGERKSRKQSRVTLVFGDEDTTDEDFDPFDGPMPPQVDNNRVTAISASSRLPRRKKRKKELVTVISSSSKLPRRKSAAANSVRTMPIVTLVSARQVPTAPAAPAPAATPVAPASVAPVAAPVATAVPMAAPTVASATPVAAPAVASATPMAAPAVADPYTELAAVAVYEAEDMSELYDDAEVSGMTKRQVKKYMKESEKKITAAKKQLAKLDAKVRDTVGRDKVTLVVESLVVQKSIIDEMSDNMVACRDAGNKKVAKQVKKAMLVEIRQYNRYVQDYQRLTGIALTQASASIPDDIMARGAYQILPVLTYNKPEANAGAKGRAVERNTAGAGDEIYVANVKQLKKFIKTSEKETIKLRSALKKKQEKKSGTKGEKRAVIIVDCITLQKSIVDKYIANLTASCQVSSKKYINSSRRALATEINVYNRYVNEYVKLTGQNLSYASTSIPSDIISGDAYEPLRAVTYKIADPNAERIKALGEIERVGAVYQAEKQKAEWVDTSILDAKTKAQANKDMAVLTQQADYEISLLESERDVTKFRYGKGHDVGVKRRRKIAKQIASIKKNHRAALKCESMDNKRYYAVVTNNPATMKTPRPNADRVKIDSLRSRMITLLNERDLINSKLSAIYTGSEYNLDGTSINQTWRNVKTDAAAKAQKKQKKMAKAVKKLNCGEGERGKIYGLMNKRVDALSTIALCKYRLKNEDNSREEARMLKQDIKKNKSAEKTLERDIQWMIKKVRKRNLHSSAAFDWIFGTGLILALVLAAAVAFFWFCGPDIVDGVKGLLG